MKDEEVEKPKLKIDNSRSRFGKDPVTPKFEELADQVMEQSQNRKERAVLLVKKFWSCIKDNTLDENKFPIKKSLEKEIISELLEFASEMNNDPQELEGAGSVAIITLLLKTVCYLRDTNNELSYRVALLEKKTSSPS